MFYNTYIITHCIERALCKHKTDITVKVFYTPSHSWESYTTRSYILLFYITITAARCLFVPTTASIPKARSPRTNPVISSMKGPKTCCRVNGWSEESGSTEKMYSSR